METFLALPCDNDRSFDVKNHCFSIISDLNEVIIIQLQNLFFFQRALQ
jgi:hypothetical protein